MTDPHELFVRPMTGFFQDPPGSNPLLFFDALCDDFSREIPYATAHQFKEAVRWFRQNRKSRTFPTIAECVEAVKSQPIAPADALPAHARSPIEKENPWSSERERLADNLLRGTELGRQAAAGGWIMPLWDWVRVNKRMPNDRELRQVEASAEKHIRHRANVAAQSSAEIANEIQPPAHIDRDTFRRMAEYKLSLCRLMETREKVICRRLFPDIFRQSLPEAAE